MGGTREQLSEAWRLKSYTVDQQQALRVAVIDAINSTDECPSLREFAESAGLSYRELRRIFRRRRTLFDAVTESVVGRAITVARNAHVSTHSIDGIIEALVWHRLAVYEAVAPVLPAVRAGRAGVRMFDLLDQTVTSETEYLLRRIIEGSRSPACTKLLSDLDTSLSLVRLDDLRQGCDMTPAVVSEVLRSEVAGIFAAQGAACFDRRQLRQLSD